MPKRPDKTHKHDWSPAPGRQGMMRCLGCPKVVSSDYLSKMQRARDMAKTVKQIRQRDESVNEDVDVKPFSQWLDDDNIDEDAPVNCAGGGAIAGLGIGPKGEPGVDLRKKRKDFDDPLAEAGKYTANTECVVCGRPAEYVVGDKPVCGNDVRSVPDDDGAGAIPIKALVKEAAVAVTLYHGTRADSVESIKRQGLTTRYNRVYVTKDLNTAKTYAHNSSGAGKKVAVIVFSVPQAIVDGMTVIDGGYQTPKLDAKYIRDIIYDVNEAVAPMPDDAFAGASVFHVNMDEVMKSRFGKSRYHRYARYVGEHENGENVRLHGRGTKNDIVLKDEKTGVMTYLRRKTQRP
jgi:hypothetical protein